MDSMSRADVSAQTVTNDDDRQSPEESGWTTYFQDFMENNYRDIEHSSSPSSGNYCCGYGTSSFLVVSDAASSAGKKTDDVGMPLEKTCKKLSFKKRRTKGAALVDDALEDTASSPVTSPKVYDLRRLDMKPGEKAAHISKGKGRSYREEEANERGNGVGFIERDSDCTDELKKRGLCLVPLSMIVDYLG